MGNANSTALGSLRIQARQRADMESNNAVTDAELNLYISQSHKELFDILVGAYGNQYHVAPYYQFFTQNTDTYPFPDGTSTYLDVNGNTALAFYKLLSVELQYSGSPTGWITMQRIEPIEVNKFGYPNTASTYSGYTNLKYLIQGNSLRLPPTPMAGQVIRMTYIPLPQSIVYLLPCALSVGSAVIPMTDTTGLIQGMSAYGTGIPAGATISSLVTNVSITLSSNSLTTAAAGMVYFWIDSAVIHGVSGWEEYIVIDAAIKMQIKQENDYSGLAGQKQAMLNRIEAMAEGRDAGQAHHVSDALAVNAWGGGVYGNGVGGFGDGSGY